MPLNLSPLLKIRYHYDMQISIAFHIIGFVLWVGGAFMLSRALAVSVGTIGDSSGGDSLVKSWGWKAFVGYVLPGAILTVFTGLYQLVVGGGPAFYFAQGWFHSKLTLVLLMLAATLVLGLKTRALLRQESVSKGAFMAVHGIAGLTLVAAVLLTVLGRA